MKPPQFKGYVLEEVLAYLIRTSGYSLITNALFDDPDLSIKRNGLNVKGRGANHQIDVLGELNWIPVFNFPIRLLVEAKYHEKIKDKTGLPVIRNQVGILADINQNYFIIGNDKPKPRYLYNSVVFSTSGFSGPAVDMAIAHQIQLVDLNIDDYKKLKNEISKFADTIAGKSEIILKEKYSGIRTYLRNKFMKGQYGNDLNTNKEECDSLIDFVKDEYGELFVGMTQGGFMLLLKANKPKEFIRVAKSDPTHKITIHWSSNDSGKIWTIKPVNKDYDYQLTFRIPQKLHDWIYKTSTDKYSEALNQKEVHFAKISIHYYEKESDRNYIFNLKFNKEDLESN